MDRLTFRTENNTALSKWLGEGHPCYVCEPAGSCSGCGFGKLIDRLAAYEDIGFLPNETKQRIENLRLDYLDAQAELERVKAEKDYAVDCIGDIITGADPCDHCNSNKDCHNLASCPSRNYINFQWRGLTTNTETED